MLACRALAYGDRDRAVLRLSLLDWAACAIAGAGEPVARAAQAAADAPGLCAVVGGPDAIPAQAALANATTGHALDYDDTHFDHIGHVSTVVVPAALAAAQAQGAGWTTFERACFAGAEAAVRMGVWLGRAHYQAGFHQTATSGAFGACIAACHAAGLDEAATRHALGLTASRAAGSKAQFGTMGKPLNAGIAAQSGVECARLAALGATSADDALDGPQGFGPTHAGEGAPIPGEARFHAVAHKLHACCHGLHAPLEALALALADGADPAAPITVTTHPRWLKVCAQPDPATGLAAKFSFRHALALRAAGHDTAALDTFSDALATDPALVAARRRVTVRTDDALADTAARISIDGRATAFDLSDPQPLEARADRVRAKARALIGERADALAAIVDQGDLRGYAGALSAA
nr:MmgE/PrpD family protein [Jannaschia sp. Os4]